MMCPVTTYQFQLYIIYLLEFTIYQNIIQISKMVARRAHVRREETKPLQADTYPLHEQLLDARISF